MANGKCRGAEWEERGKPMFVQRMDSLSHILVAAFRLGRRDHSGHWTLLGDSWVTLEVDTSTPSSQGAPYSVLRDHRH